MLGDGKDPYDTARGVGKVQQEQVNEQQSSAEWECYTRD